MFKEKALVKSPTRGATTGFYELYLGDCIEWLKSREPNSIHAVVTDPPFGLKEFNEEQIEKLRSGRGGVWRLPPKIGGVERSPLPRFTDLKRDEINEIKTFFQKWSELIEKVLTPGGHVFVASNSLLAPIVFSAILEGGLEPRGQIIRLVRTLRGGDRPKGHEKEFSNVSTMPRACHEPWGVFRKSLDGTVAATIRRWKTGGIQRLSADSPLPDVIESTRTSLAEKNICNHPNLKPQEFMRLVVRASLPLGEGIVLDPFMGGGSTIAAAQNIGYQSIGIELDRKYFTLAKNAIPHLSKL